MTNLAEKNVINHDFLRCKINPLVVWYIETVERRMRNMNERLKQVRKGLKLSQEFVAKQLGMTRTTIVAIEAGTRKVTTDELTKFSELYGVTIDELLYGDVSEENEVKAFARSFSELSDIDKKEIMNLINFKRRYKETVS